jgi:hypothetical protein
VKLPLPAAIAALATGEVRLKERGCSWGSAGDLRSDPLAAGTFSI